MSKMLISREILAFFYSTAPKPCDSASGSFGKETGLPRPKNFLFIFLKGARAYKIQKVEKIFPILARKSFWKRFSAESRGGGSKARKSGLVLKKSSSFVVKRYEENKVERPYFLCRIDKYLFL
jgi:hypothetical protein